MIILDTSTLVEVAAGIPTDPIALCARRLLARGERLMISTLVLYEFLRGPRVPAHIAAQEAIFPPDKIISFGPAEATIGARLYRTVTRARSREIDIAIAATAISHGATVWTLNPADFQDLPGVKLLATE